MECLCSWKRTRVTIQDIGARYTQARILLQASLGPAAARDKRMLDVQVQCLWLKAALGNFPAGGQEGQGANVFKNQRCFSSAGIVLRGKLTALQPPRPLLWTLPPRPLPWTLFSVLPCSPSCDSPSVASPLSFLPYSPSFPCLQPFPLVQPSHLSALDISIFKKIF